MILRECYWQSCAVKMLAVTTADWCVLRITMTRWNYSRPGTVRSSCLKPARSGSVTEAMFLRRPWFWLSDGDNLVCVNKDNATV